MAVHAGDKEFKEAWGSLSMPITRSRQPDAATKAPLVSRCNSSCLASGTVSPHWLMAPLVTPIIRANAIALPAYSIASVVFMCKS